MDSKICVMSFWPSCECVWNTQEIKLEFCLCNQFTPLLSPPYVISPLNYFYSVHTCLFCYASILKVILRGGVLLTPDCFSRKGQDRFGWVRLLPLASLLRESEHLCSALGQFCTVEAVESLSHLSHAPVRSVPRLWVRVRACRSSSLGGSLSGSGRRAFWELSPEHQKMIWLQTVYNFILAKALEHNILSSSLL